MVRDLLVQGVVVFIEVVCFLTWFQKIVNKFFLRSFRLLLFVIFSASVAFILYGSVCRYLNGSVWIYMPVFVWRILEWCWISSQGVCEIKNRLIENSTQQGCPTFLPGRIEFMKSPFENMEGRFSLRNLPMEGRKDILPLKSPLENSKGESLLKISLPKRENIFSGEF